VRAANLSFPPEQNNGEHSIANGLEAWDEVLGCNYEGMVAKDPRSSYTPGRTLSWLKVRQRGYRQEARGFDQGEFVLSRNIKLIKEVSATSGHLSRNRV
jgi:hypothetical protein